MRTGQTFLKIWFIDPFYKNVLVKQVFHESLPIGVWSLCMSEDQCFMLCIITSPPEGVARYCFHPVCLCVGLSVYLCVRPIFWYDIYRLLAEISI